MHGSEQGKSLRFVWGKGGSGEQGKSLYFVWLRRKAVIFKLGKVPVLCPPFLTHTHTHTHTHRCFATALATIQIWY